MFYSFPKEKIFIKSLSVVNSGNQLNIIKRLYENTDEPALWDFSRLNRAESIVAHALCDNLYKQKMPPHWQQVHEKLFKRISAYMTELDNAASLLSSQAIPMVALKNAGIARGIYPCVGCCPMGDVDVLVRPSDFRQAHKILIDNGFQLDSRCPFEKVDLNHAEQSGGAEYTKILPNGETLWFELQWRPIAGRWIRPDQEPSADELMARSIPIDGTAVRLLAPEDNLLQVSLHTAKHSYVRAPGFRLHTDVDRIVNYQKIDWDIFLERVLKLQVKTAVYFSLLIPNELFKTPIPDNILDQLKPGKWKELLLTKWIQKAGLFNPDEKKFCKIGYILFTSLLYDDLKGFLRGILPDKKWMETRYGTSNSMKLVFFYLKRLVNLAFRRVNT